MSAEVNAQSRHVHAPPKVNVAPLEVNVQLPATTPAPTVVKVHYCINIAVIILYLNMVYDVTLLH